MQTSPVGIRRFAVAAQSAVVEAGSVTPVAWQVRTGVWAGAVPCSAPVASQWFVGATADITSKGSLNVVNSGLGRALVEIDVFTENGAQAEQVFAVKANSFSAIGLATLSPGSKLLALHIVPQTGRVNAFLIDERGRGLRALGGDTVNSITSPAKSAVIPAIPHVVAKKKPLPHTLRILIPGEVGANLSAVISSTDGTFAPAGVDGRFIPAGKVIEIPLNPQMATGKFSLSLNSERPFVASVVSQTLSGGKSDFVWSTSVPALAPSSYSITGLAPLLIFTGDAISVELEVSYPRAKVRRSTIRGAGIASLQLGDTARTVTIIKSSKDVYGAALISSKSGYGFAPLVAGSRLTRSTLPQSNIRVLVP
jgi:hypothetical protein